MAIGRKENGSLVKKAGKTLVDLALSLTSNNAIANSAVTSRLTANNQTLQLAYQNNKYGFTIGGVFYPLGGGGMRCVKQGKFTPTQELTTINISDLGFTDPLDYVVVLSGDGSSQGSNVNSCNALDEKTATSFSVRCGTRGGTVQIYYQVLANQ